MNQLRTLWTPWINPQHLSVEGLSAIAMAFRRSTAAVQLHDFWNLERVQSLQPGLETANWRRLCALRQGDEVRRVSWPAFVAADALERFSTHDVLSDVHRLTEDPAPTPGTRELVDFILFVSGPAMSAWIAMIIGIPDIAATSAEFARYTRDDYIDWHSDNLPGRMLNIAGYLDPTWTANDGGHLLVKAQSGYVERFEPAFNSLVLLRIDESCSHRVQKWQRHLPGRYAVSVSFGPNC